VNFNIKGDLGVNFVELLGRQLMQEGGEGSDDINYTLWQMTRLFG